MTDDSTGFEPDKVEGDCGVEGDLGGKQAINVTVSNDGQKSEPDKKPWQIQPGQVLNPKGRPKGSKNKLGQAFVNDLYQHWQDNGLQAIEKVYQDKPDVYLKVVAQIIPRDINVNHEVGDMTREQIIERIKQLDRQLGPILDMAANEPDQ